MRDGGGVCVADEHCWCLGRKCGVIRKSYSIEVFAKSHTNTSGRGIIILEVSMKRTILFKLSLLLAILFFTGCAGSLPPLSFSVPNVGLSPHKIEAEVKSLTVTTARPDEATGEFALGVGPATCTLWKTSLQEALDKMLIFRDDAPKKVTLSVKILKLAVPSAGISFTTKTDAKYEITDRSNGDIIYSGIINSEGTTPASYAFLGIARARESINRAVQNNILQFLQVLDTLDISKPMFPANNKKEGS